MSLKLLVFGDLLNLDRACLRCLIASLQSPLYHGLLLVVGVCNCSMFCCTLLYDY